MMQGKIRFVPLLGALLLAWSWGGGQDVDADQAGELMRKPGVVVLDVRTPREYAAGHIENARLVPLQELQGNPDWSQVAPDAATPVIAYCAVGGRSAAASRILREHGYRNVYNLKGGIAAWKEAGRPVVGAGGK